MRTNKRTSKFKGKSILIGDLRDLGIQENACYSESTMFDILLSKTATFPFQ